jgi:hypothetical protein
MTARGLRARLHCDEGQAFLETVMVTGFLVAIAVVLNRLFGPVILEAFEKISKALSSVGP